MDTRYRFSCVPHNQPPGEVTPLPGGYLRHFATILVGTDQIGQFSCCFSPSHYLAHVSRLFAPSCIMTASLYRRINL